MMLDEKVQLFRENKENLLIISDFDFTITNYRDEFGNNAPNSINVYRRGNLMPEGYSEESEKIAEKYLPYIHDIEIPEDEKYEAMDNWWKEHFEVIKKYKFPKDIYDKIAKDNIITLRNDFDKFTKIVHSNNIPFLIFSAGIREMIIKVLEYNLSYEKEIHVIANMFKYDSEDNFIGLEGDLIHSMSKGRVDLSKYSFYDDIKSKK